MPRGQYVRKKKGATNNATADAEIPVPLVKRKWARRTPEVNEQTQVTAKTVVIKIKDTTLLLTVAEIPK
jgi:hypothetical protein